MNYDTNRFLDNKFLENYNPGIDNMLVLRVENKFHEVCFLNFCLTNVGQ